MYTSFEGFLWTPWLTIFHQCLTDLKEQVTIPAFTIRKETQIIGMSHNLVQSGDSSELAPRLPYKGKSVRNRGVSQTNALPYDTPELAPGRLHWRCGPDLTGCWSPAS